MKKHLLAALLTFLLIPGALRAQVALQIDPTTPMPGTLSAGQSFSFDLQLVNGVNPDIVGYSYALQVVNSAQKPVSGIFSLSGFTITNAALSQANSSGLGLPISLNPRVGPANQPTDLGAITSDSKPNAGLGEGTFDLETLTFTVNANVLPGVYELEFYQPGTTPGAITIFDSSFSEVGTATGPLFSSAITIETVPEPTVWAFMLVGGVVLLWLKRRPASLQA